MTALVGAPIGALALLARPRWRHGLAERLGGLPRLAGGPVWLHGASVGEARLVARMADALAARGHSSFATVQTASGLGALRRIAPSLPCGLAPLDHPWCVDRAFRRVAPRALVLFETELWPAWIAAAGRCGVPVGVVSGRISDRAWPRYRRITRVMKGTFGRLTEVGARSPRDAERFVALGADPKRVRVTGDLKWAPPVAGAPLDEAVAAALRGRTVFVAGSTHVGEEQAALTALQVVEAAGHAPTLVVAPRHLERTDAVARELREAGRSVRLRSQLDGKPLADGEVLVLDTYGELQAVYGLARFAFVGGTLARVGGHDPLEAVQHACPVVVGPDDANVRESVDTLVEAGVATRVDDAVGLGEALRAELEKSEPACRPGFADWRARGQAVLTRSVELVERLLERGPS